MRGGALVNCTVAENRAWSGDQIGHGAGVFVERGGLTNCLIYSNYCVGDAPPAPDNQWFNAGPGIFDHCCTLPDPGGVGNILQDPQFLDLTNGNFHLASTSPCIGAGVVQPWMANALDLDGNPRTTNGVVDIGAYQSPLAEPPPPPAANFSANPTSGNAPLAVQFTDQSSGSITGWAWDFGDGSANSSAQNPLHTYTNAGDYTATLTVTGSGGSSGKSLAIHVAARVLLQIGATAVGTVANGSLASIVVSDGGSGYVEAPNVTFVGGGGSGAMAIAIVSGGSVSEIDIVAAGSGYTSAPVVVIDPPPPVATPATLSISLIPRLVINGQAGAGHAA